MNDTTSTETPSYLVVGLFWVMLLCSSPCPAFLGFGDIVFDPSVFMQTVMGYVKDDGNCQQYRKADRQPD